MKSRKYFLKKTLIVCFYFGIFRLMVSQSYSCFVVFLLITSSCNKLFSFVVLITCSCSELCSFVVLIACSCHELNEFCLFGQPFTTTSTAQSSWAMCWPTPPHAVYQLRTTRGDANSPKVNVMWVAVYKALHYNCRHSNDACMCTFSSVIVLTDWPIKRSTGSHKSWS